MRLRHEPLDNVFVRLEPLQTEHHDALAGIVRRAPESFVFWSGLAPGDWFPDWIAQMAGEQDRGRSQLYAVVPGGGSHVLGMSGFLNIDAANASVEIGSTFYAPEVQGTAVNPAAKRLLLAHAFDAGANRVSFQVDARNERSQLAVSRLGAVREGVLRAHRVLPSGHVRDTVVFSILKAEWPGVREGLDARLQAYLPSSVS
jgi:RimJ/RimL family protein N-acetyltransferase